MSGLCQQRLDVVGECCIELVVVHEIPSRDIGCWGKRSITAFIVHDACDVGER